MKETNDILTLFESLNNHEVFTPPRVAKKLLGFLPLDMWKNPNAKFLDPSIKSGVFLREIFYLLNEGLNGLGKHEGFDGNIYDLNNPQERVNHILKNMLFGIATSELTSYMSRRTLYGVMEADKDKQDEIVNYFQASSNYKNWSEDEKCEFIVRNEYNEYYDMSIFKDKNYDGFEKEGNIFYPNEEINVIVEETNNYEIEEKFFPFIYKTNHKKINEILSKKRLNKITNKEEEMKFDVIIGNPPYQIQKGGKNVIPLYHEFVEGAIKLEPKYIIMITPSRWLTETSQGRKQIINFRKNFIKLNHIEKIFHFENSKDCFPSVDLPGGVSYFLWNKNHNGECEFFNMSNDKVIAYFKTDLNKYDIIPKSIDKINIVEKVLKKEKSFLDKKVSGQEPFVPAKMHIFKGASEKPFLNSIKFYGNKKDLPNTGGVGYVDRSRVTRRQDLIGLHKILTSKANGAAMASGKILSEPIYAEPDTICSETYLVLNAFSNKVEADNFIDYVKTKFFRYMLSIRKNTQNSTFEAYAYVPDLNMNQKWTDEELYKRYDLSKEEIEIIENSIKDMG